MESGTESQTSRGLAGIAIAWAIAVVGSVIVIVATATGARWSEVPLAGYAALGVVFAASVLGSLLVQLATRRPEGFVERASASVGGAAIVVALAAGVVALVA